MNWMEAGDTIILISAIIMAVSNIWNFLRDKGVFVSKKWKDGQKELVMEVLKEVLPNILLQHDLETRQKYLNDRERYLNEIKNQVSTEMKTDLNPIGVLEQQVKELTTGFKDVLREKIMALYHKNKADRKLSEHEREALVQYYKDYKAVNGNSYIDKYYERMKKWQTIPEEYDEE